MDNCSEYMEQISAYADGELTESDKLKLEDHLRVCTDCSSILEVYRRITLTVEESCIPAPESLCGSIMERIASETAAQNAANMKKFKTVNRILTRYLPAAACLAFLLLTIPRLFGSGGPYNRTQNASAPMSAPMPSAEDSGALAPASGGGSLVGGVFNEDAEESNNEYSEEYSADTAASASSSDTGGAAPAVSAIPQDEHNAPSPFPQPNEPAVEIPPANNAASAASEAGDNDSLRDEEGARGDNEVPHGEDASAAVLPPMEMGAGQQEPNDEPSVELNVAPNEVPEEPEETQNAFLQDVYATIIINGSIIKGSLPALFSQYMPEDFDIDEIGYMSFEIPREQAEMLISYISDLDGVVINISDENGTRAMVYYIP